MAYGTRVSFDAVREKAFGDVTGSYTALGVPLSDHIRILALNNGTDADVYISFDGTTDHLRLASNSFKLLDFSSNKIRDDGLFLASGTQVYVKDAGSSPTSGDVWAEAVYAVGGK